MRTAHVRAIGPCECRPWEPRDHDLRIYRQLRADSESLNRTVEDSLYRHHRAHRKCWARQQSDMLGLAGLINALIRERLRRQSLSQAA